MDATNMILDMPVSKPELFGKLDPVASSVDGKKMEFAKQFESIMMHRVLESMKNSIGEWGFEVDGAARQTFDMFWFHLGEEIGNQGGLGLSKQIYESLCPTDEPAAPEQLDQSL